MNQQYKTKLLKIKGTWDIGEEVETAKQELDSASGLLELADSAVPGLPENLSAAIDQQLDQDDDNKGFLT